MNKKLNNSLKETRIERDVWPLTVRITHWLVAVFVLTNFVNDTGYWHRIIGYVCLILIAIRIIHAAKTKIAHARLFWPTSHAILQHLKEISSGVVTEHAGHNPLGQLAVYGMWLLIALLGFTGWLSRTDAYWGEDWPVDLHNYLSDALMLMVLLHLLAIVIISKLQKQNLVKRMIAEKSN
ncbi:MAG TPA: cytochrome b/b6 domain-containing protein [Methylotenera sp.]|nr:cytochrome b/b6 domain-containing protein [Methylotenera sp.]